MENFVNNSENEQAIKRLHEMENAAQLGSGCCHRR